MSTSKGPFRDKLNSTRPCPLESRQYLPNSLSSHGLAVSILVFLSLSSILFLDINPVKGIVGAGVGSCPSPPPPGCIPDTWAPYGPMIKSLRFQIYAYPDPEFQDFQAGHLDVVDWETNASSWPSYDSNPDFLQTPTQGQFGELGIYFNSLSSTFTRSPDNGLGPWWGCD